MRAAIALCRIGLAACTIGLSGASAVACDPVLHAPQLGASSNFGQGAAPALLDRSTLLPLRDFRDEVFWEFVEDVGGTLSFATDQTRYPDRIGALGAAMTLIVNNPHPAYDGGQTPVSDAAIAAFARHAAATVARFPAIRTVEVGNEMNSDTFVTGPRWTGPLPGRAAVYTRLLAATAAAVRAVDPEVKILGAAAHSIPLAWFSALIDAGAMAHMDALVLHTYTTAPEQLVRQIALLRALPGLASIPIAVTEFGQTDPARAPAHLLMNYCQMSLAGVASVMWYPFNDRGDGFVPLLDNAGALTETGQTFGMIDRDMAGRPVRDAAPDPFTYACLFGDDLLVIWGAPRPVYVLAPGLDLRDAAGRPLAGDGLMLSRDAPLVIRASGAPIDLGGTIGLGPQQVIADSFDQFAYPGTPGAGNDPFTRLARLDGEEFALETRPGQDRNGMPWTPHLGSLRDGVVRAEAALVVPSAWGERKIETILRFTATAATRFDLAIRVAPSPDSQDGVQLTVLRAGDILRDLPVRTPQMIVHPGMSLDAGDRLDIIIGPGETPDGDIVDLRVTLTHPQDRQ